MAVGGVGGKGGGRGGAKGVGGGKPASGGSFSNKVSGADKADATESLVGVSGTAGSSEVGGVASTGTAGKASGVQNVDAVTAGAQAIAKALKDGTLASKSEATQKLVGLILKDKNLLGKNDKASKKLIERIADTLQDDPRLAAALDRTWSRTGQKS
jgi:hypothetical protein